MLLRMDVHRLGHEEIHTVVEYILSDSCRLCCLTDVYRRPSIHMFIQQSRLKRNPSALANHLPRVILQARIRAPFDQILHRSPLPCLRYGEGGSGSSKWIVCCTGSSESWLYNVHLL